MATLHPDDFVRIVTLAVPEAATGLTFSPDGSLLAVATADKVHIFRVPVDKLPTAGPARDFVEPN